MKILFNALGCGLGNNGGTHTIVSSINCLNKLKHNASLAAVKNNYDWGCVSNFIGEMRDTVYSDVVVNVSVWDVDYTLLMSCDKKVWWMRGWEKWVKGEQYLIGQIKKFVGAGGKIIVNSSWLIQQLKEKCGVDSQLCYSGLDLDFWKPSVIHTDKHTIGALWHPKHKTKNYSMFSTLKAIYNERTDMVFQTVRGNLTQEQMRIFYGNCNAWLSLSELEGFHQCPAEAALCGCDIIYNDVDSGGTRDYCTPETATPFKSFSELVLSLENQISSQTKRDKMQEVLVNKIGSRESNMKKFVEML